MVTQRLAGHADIRLGAVVVRPATHEIEGPTGVETIEPRMMEVLVVLLAAAGTLVTRDTLIARCWDGRIVGDDAITRVISRLRRLSAGVAGGTFTITTISKSGYRLTIAAGDAAPTGQPAAAPPSPRFRARVAVALAACVFVALAAGWAAIRRPAMPATAVAGDRDPAARDLEARGRALVFEGSRDDTRRGIAYLREAALREPGRGEAWGGLALGHVRSLLHTPAGDQATVVLRIRDAAARAFALDPHEALATAALVSLDPTFGYWAAKDAALRAALATAHGNRTAVLFQHAQFLAAVGRTAEALDVTEEAAALSPLLPWIQAMRIDLLATTGRLEAADEAAARAARLWPRDPRLWLVRFDLKAFSGRSVEAAAMAADRTTWPVGLDAADLTRAAAAAHALASGLPRDADAVLAAGRAAVDRDPSTAEQAIRVAAGLGRADAAIALITRVYRPGTAVAVPSRFDYVIGRIAPGERNTIGLFVAPTVRLAADPRFMAAVGATGLADYWRRSRAPDLCAAAAAACARLGLSAARSDRRSPAGR